jgi:hypothetical protein
MHPREPHATIDRRLLWMSAFAVALWLFLVNPTAALAGGDHPSHGWDSSDNGSDSWQHGTEGTPPSWGHTPDQGQPPSEESGPGQPCENQGPPEQQPPVETPPVETPPVETPPEHSPPVETPPEHTPPEHTPPVETPPVVTPPVETPPVETPPVVTPPEVTPPVGTPPEYTPPVESPPVETPPTETPVETPHHPTTSPNAPNTRAEHGGGTLAQEQGQTGAGGVVTASPAESALPFTGSEIPLVMLLGVAFLGVGLVLHRVSAARG